MSQVKEWSSQKLSNLLTGPDEAVLEFRIQIPRILGLEPSDSGQPRHQPESGITWFLSNSWDLGL